MHRSSTFHKRKQYKKNMLVDFNVRRQRLDCFTGGSVITWILEFCYKYKLTSGTHSLQRIRWRASYTMLNFSKSVQMKKRSHVHLVWPEDEYILSKCSFLSGLFL